MNKRNNLASALLSLIIGILFCIFKGGVIGIATTIIGVCLIVLGVLLLISGDMVSGLVYLVLGIVIIIFGWVLAKIVLYILAVVLIIIGVLELIGYSKQNIKGTNFGYTLLVYLMPILNIVIGILLFFNQGGTVDWIFYVTGILLIIDGVLGILGSSLTK